MVASQPGPEVIMRHSHNQPPTQPRKVSQRGLLSIAMLMVSLGAFVFAALGGIKLVFDILDEHTVAGRGAQVVTVVLAYFVGWFTAMVAIRVYGNLILPILLRWATWGCLIGVCYLYILILQRMYLQPDNFGTFVKYLTLITRGLGALVGLLLIFEDHDLRPFSIPLLILCLYQLGQIVFRYVFDTGDVNPSFLWKDLILFFGMAAVSSFMLAHRGLLDPLRSQITNYFDHNSTAIRTED